MTYACSVKSEQPLVPLISYLMFSRFTLFLFKSVLCHRAPIAYCEMQCAVVFIPSLQPFEVLHHREVVIACCLVQWCPISITPHFRVSPMLAQIQYNREVICECCQELLSPVKANIPRLQIYLRSLHNSIHNLQLSSFAGYKKAATMGQVLGLITPTLGISQVQLPAPPSMFLTKSVQRSASMDVNVLNVGSARCAYWRILRSQCASASLLDCITQCSFPNSFWCVKLERKLGLILSLARSRRSSDQFHLVCVVFP